MSFEYDKVLCPECNGEMVSRTGKFGVFWGCKKFPECKGTRDSNGRSKQDREAYKIAKQAEGQEWQRNKDDGISWNQQERENPLSDIDRDSGRVVPNDLPKTSFNKKG